MILAMLSFHDEDHNLLRAALESAGRAGVSMILAVPGPYALYPHRHVEPTSSELNAIFAAGRDFDMEVDLLAPRIWEGNEVAKRQSMLQRALELTQPHDWLLVLDADYLIIRVPTDLEHRLDPAYDVASAKFVEHFDQQGVAIESPLRQPIYCLHRARRDLHMGTNHYTYVTGRGQTSIIRHTSMPCLNLYDEMTVEHRRHLRAKVKLDAQASYYEQRDVLRVES